MAEKSGLTIKILVLIIVLLVLVIAYVLALKPAVSGFIVKKQVGAYQQGQADTLNSIWVQIQQTGAAQIPLGDNSVLVLQGQIFQTQAAQAQ